MLLNFKQKMKQNWNVEKENDYYFCGKFFKLFMGKHGLGKQK